jgi:hypothetical protein
MAIESQVLNFIFSAKDAGFTALTNKVSAFMNRLYGQTKDVAGGAPQVGRLFKTLFGDPKNVDQFANSMTTSIKGVSLLSKTVKYLVDIGVDYQEMLIGIRKNLMSNSKEASAFGQQMLEGSARYGVAMNKIGLIATAMAHGTDVARANSVTLAAALGNIAERTDLSTESTAKFGQMLTSVNGMAMFGTKKTVQAMFALQEVASASNMSMENMVQTVMDSQDPINALGGDTKKITQKFVDLAGAINHSGGSMGTAKKVMSEVSKEGTRLNAVFKGNDQSFRKMSEIMRHLVISSKGNLNNLQDQAAQYGLTTTEAMELAAAQEHITENEGKFATAMGASEADIQAIQEQRMGTWEKAGYQFSKLMGGVKQELTSATDYWAKFLSPPMEGFTGLMEEWNKIFRRGTAGIIDAATEASKQLMDIIANKIQDKANPTVSGSEYLAKGGKWFEGAEARKQRIIKEDADTQDLSRYNDQRFSNNVTAILQQAYTETQATQAQIVQSITGAEEGTALSNEYLSAIAKYLSKMSTDSDKPVPYQFGQTTAENVTRPFWASFIDG